MAVKRLGSRSLAFCWAMRALVLAGLPTTSTLTSRWALRRQRLALRLEDAAVGAEQVGPLHAVLAGHGADEQGDVDVAEGHVGVVGLHHAGEQREGAVLELHGHAARGRRAPGVISSIWRITGWSGPEHRARLAMRNSRSSRSARQHR